MLKIIQIYFDEESKSNCFNHHCVELFFNEESPHPFFENKIILEKVPLMDSEYIGVFSHKFRKKRKKNIEYICLKVKDKDVYSFFSKDKYRSVIKHMEEHHNGSREIMKYICENIGLRLSNVLTPVYQNHFIAKKEVYHDYVNNYLSKAMSLMENDPYLIDKCNKKAAKSGKYATYTLHTFVLERLFSVYCKNKNIQIQII